MNVAPDFEPASCLGRRSLVALMIMGLALATLTAAEPGRIIAQHEIREGFIAVTGGKVWFRIIGAGKPGLPLLTLHGGPGGTSEPFEALAPLADERPLVLYDQLGSGRSDRPADNSPYTIERYVSFSRQLGRDDVALFKLASPVPAAVATPALQEVSAGAVRPATLEQ